MHLSLPADVWAAILAEPDDDAPRLAAAALLRERGDVIRAEFIEAQCDFAREVPGGEHSAEGREYAALVAILLGEGWAGRLTGATEYRRGFAEATTFAPRSPADVLPISPETLTLRDLYLDLSRCPGFRAEAITGLPIVRLVCVTAGELTAAAWAGLERAYPGARITYGPRPGDSPRGTIPLAALPLPVQTLLDSDAQNVCRAGELSVRFRVPSDAATLLDHPSQLADVEVLRLSRAALTPGDLAALLRATPRLCVLDLDAVRLDRRHWEAIPPLPRLRELRLTGHALPDEVPPLDAPRLLAAKLDPPVRGLRLAEVRWTRRELALGLSVELPEIFREADAPAQRPSGDRLAGGAWVEDERRADPLPTAGPARAAWTVWRRPVGVSVPDWLRAEATLWDTRHHVPVADFRAGRDGARLREVRRKWTRLAFAFDAGDGRILCLRMEFGERLLPLEAWFEGAVDSLEVA